MRYVDDVTWEDATQWLQKVQDHFGYIVMGNNYPHEIGAKAESIRREGGTLHVSGKTFEVSCVVIGVSTFEEWMEQAQWLGQIHDPLIKKYQYYYRLRAE